MLLTVTLDHEVPRIALPLDVSHKAQIIQSPILMLFIWYEVHAPEQILGLLESNLSYVKCTLFFHALPHITDRGIED